MKVRPAVLATAAAAAAAATGVIALSVPANAATVTPSAASSAAPTASSAAVCERAPWADRVQGEPAGFSAGDRGGDYLWHDATGFHLRVTHKNDNREVYTGEITSPVPLHLQPVQLERGDVARLSADHRTIVFAFVDYGHIDGLNFQTDCASSVTVSHLNVGNAALTPDRVYLGATSAHPARIPFTVHRA